MVNERSKNAQEVYDSRLENGQARETTKCQIKSDAHPNRQVDCAVGILPYDIAQPKAIEYLECSTLNTVGMATLSSVWLLIYQDRSYACLCHPGTGHEPMFQILSVICHLHVQDAYPAGPAPTIRTSVSSVVCVILG